MNPVRLCSNRPLPHPHPYTRGAWGWVVSVAMLSSVMGWAVVTRAAAGKFKQHDVVGLGVGYLAPSFSANDLAGVQRTVKPHDGRILVLHFWASWCPYCRGEIPKLTRLHQEWASKKVDVLTVSTDQDLDTLKQFLSQMKLPYPVIADLQTDPSVSDQYGISGIPVTYVILPDGHIASKLNGASDIIGAVEQTLATRSSS